MQVKDLFEFEDDLYIDKRIDRERNLIPIFNSTEVSDENILILPKRLRDKKYVIPEFKDSRPYAIIAGQDIIDDDNTIPLIKVKNPRKSASYIFSKEYSINYGELKIIGITGTNGKTTTSELLFRILREAGYNVGYIGTGEIRVNEKILSDINNTMTTPDPDVLYKALQVMKEENCEYVVMEVSSHSLALSKVAPIQFKCALFTNLSEEHMDFHTDIEDYYQTKLLLFKKTDYGIFNLDDPYSKRASEENGVTGYRVGIINTTGDAYITDYSNLGLDGSSFFYKEQDLIFKVDLHIGGPYNVYNALMVIKCAISLGIKPCIARKAILKIDRVRGRLDITRSDITVVIDYAHTIEAFRELLKFLKSTLKCQQKLICVFGCGGDRDKRKRAPMGKIAEEYSDIVIVTEDNSRSESFESIAKMITGNMKKERHVIIESREEAIRTAILSADTEDVVAIVGKGHEKYIIDNIGRRDFDESEIIKTALFDRKNKYAN